MSENLNADLIARSKSDFVWLVHDISAVKARFLDALKDKTISLNDRWDLFVAAPAILKNHGGDLCSAEFEAFKKHCTGSEYTAWLGNCYERREVIETVSIVGTIAIYKEQGNTAIWRNEYYAKVDLNELKEEILSDNLATFVYDW